MRDEKDKKGWDQLRFSREVESTENGRLHKWPEKRQLRPRSTKNQWVTRDESLRILIYMYRFTDSANLSIFIITVAAVTEKSGKKWKFFKVVGKFFKKSGKIFDIVKVSEKSGNSVFRFIVHKCSSRLRNAFPFGEDEKYAAKQA